MALRRTDGGTRLFCYLLADPALSVVNLNLLLKKSARKERRRHLDLWAGHNFENRDEPVDIAFVVPSFGEFVLAKRLFEELQHRGEHLRCGWLLGDPELVPRVRNYGPWTPEPVNGPLHCFRALKCLNPRAILFFGECRNTNLAKAARCIGTETLTANARSDRHPGSPVSRWFHRWLFNSFNAIYPESESAKSAYVAHGVPAAIPVVGNMKFDLAPRQGTPESDSVDRWLCGVESVLFAAGSLKNEREDRFVLEAFDLVRRTTRSKLILAPRRIQRADEIVALARKLGFDALRRTHGSVDADVLVLDTLGELQHVYGHSAAAFVGGTIGGAGHNVLEPLQSGVPTSFGPAGANVAGLKTLCLHAGVAREVTTPAELAEAWTSALGEADQRDAFRLQAKRFLDCNRGATSAIAQDLAYRLARPTRALASPAALQRQGSPSL